MTHMTMVAKEAILMRGRKKSFPVKGASSTKEAVNQMHRVGVPYFGWSRSNQRDTKSNWARPYIILAAE